MCRPDRRALQKCRRLVSDLSTLLSNGWQFDVTLRAGGRDLKAHSSILTSGSPVFKSMFGSGMIDTRIGVVEIADVDPDILNHMCGFMYTIGLATTTGTDGSLRCRSASMCRALTASLPNSEFLQRHPHRPATSQVERVFLCEAPLPKNAKSLAQSTTEVVGQSDAHPYREPLPESCFSMGS